MNRDIRYIVVTNVGKVRTSGTATHEQALELYDHLLDILTDIYGTPSKTEGRRTLDEGPGLLVYVQFGDKDRSLSIVRVY